jgi:hypothetical protein
VQRARDRARGRKGFGALSRRIDRFLSERTDIQLAAQRPFRASFADAKEAFATRQPD